MKRVLRLSASISSTSRTSGGDAASIGRRLRRRLRPGIRADIPAFMQSYENSPEIMFDSAIRFAGDMESILERYKQAYIPTAAQTGSLTFSNVEVRLLPPSCGKRGVCSRNRKFPPGTRGQG